MQSTRAKTSILSFLLASLICIVAMNPLPALAQSGNLDITGAFSPSKVVEGDSVHISVTLTNGLSKDITNWEVQFFIYKGSSTPSQFNANRSLMVAKGSSSQVSFDWKSKGTGSFTVMVVVVDETGNNQAELDFPNKIIVSPAPVVCNGSITCMQVAGIPILFVLVIVILIVVILVVIALRKRKHKKKPIVITGEGVEVTGRVAWGKMPENYYKERRDRLSKLRPVGLTRDGRTIMGNSTVGELGAVAEVEHATDPNATRICQKCGYEMTAGAKTCLKCEAIANIKETKALLKTPAYQGKDLDFAEVIVRQADAAFESENYTEANVFALDARSKVEDYGRKLEAERRLQDDGTKAGTDQGPAKPFEPKPSAPTLKPPPSCPSCGMGMQDGWTKCPVCGMTVEDMLKPTEDAKPQQGPQMVQVAPQQTYTCSTCGNEKDSQTAACVHCNTGRAITNAEKKVKELKLWISTQSISSENQLEINEAFDLFQDAKGAFQDKDYNTAVGLSGETMDLVDELMARFKPKAPTQAAVPAKPAPPTPTQATMALADNKCPKCGMSVKNTWEICPACNAQLRAPTPATAAQKTCPKCSKPVKDRWTICPFCESPLN